MDRSEQLYNYQRRSAKKRNIAWQLTYKEWYILFLNLTLSEFVEQ